jgi:hypothetical protein
MPGGLPSRGFPFKSRKINYPPGVPESNNAKVTGTYDMNATIDFGGKVVFAGVNSYTAAM